MGKRGWRGVLEGAFIRGFHSDKKFLPRCHYYYNCNSFKTQRASGGSGFKYMTISEHFLYPPITTKKFLPFELYTVTVDCRRVSCIYRDGW